MQEPQRFFYELPLIETMRTRLRKVQRDDCEGVFSCCADPLVAKYSNWRRHQTLDDTIHFIDYLMYCYQVGKPAPWAIIDKQTNRFIGTCGFVDLKLVEGKAEIGYMLAREYWNKGIMSEVVHGILCYGFTELQLSQIEAKCLVHNYGSARVLQKNKLQKRGVLQTFIWSKGRYELVEHYQITKEQFIE